MESMHSSNKVLTVGEVLLHIYYTFKSYSDVLPEEGTGGEPKGSSR